jgi:diguanylate cyclase
MDRHDEGRRFARRMYLPRTVGLGLGALAIGAGLYEVGAPAWVWVLLVVNLFGWPHVAYAAALRSRNPYRAELRNLMLDSAFGGAWIAAMHFNLAPSAILVATLAMDKAAVGGMKFLARCLLAQAAALIVVAVAAGIELTPLQSGNIARLGIVPLLMIYPVMVALTAYRLAQRVRDQNRLLSALSRTDGLTQLLNRQAWEQAAAAEVSRCRRGGGPASLLMLDIDHFKAINDRHGHPAGDAVLRGVAQILRDTLREEDLPGRYGGEEFGVVLPNTSAAGAAVAAERVRARIEAAVLERRAGIRATASIGFAELGPQDADCAAWIARADRALYAAKAAGRNRCVRFEAVLS